MSLLSQLKLLRDEAWNAVTKTKEYQDFVVVEKAYGELNGGRHPDNKLPSYMPGAGGIGSVVARAGGIGSAGLRPGDIGGALRKRATQAGTAETVLWMEERPMPIGELLKACIDHGLVITGGDPLSNFRSTMSRDPRFTNFQQNGTYYWWLADTPIPEKWRAEAGMLDLPTTSARQSDEEGGGGDDADNTDLAS